MSYPGQRGFICEGFCVSFSYIINKSIRRSWISNFALLVFLYSILQKQIFTHTHIYRSPSTLDLTGNDSTTASYDFENPINLAEEEGEDDCKVPGELARLLLHEERVIQPHEELVESVNLGTKTDKKEVKIGANLEPSVKQRLIQMLHDIVEIFASSY